MNRTGSSLITRTAMIAVLLCGGANTAALTLDLTQDEQSSGTLNGGFFIRTDAQPTGTGYIRSFVRIQNKGIEEGFNADVRPVMSDVKTDRQFTRDVLLGEVGIVHNPAGQPGSYYEFLLDLNEISANQLISMDGLEIYTRPSPLSSADKKSDLSSAGSVLRYSLDAGTDNEVLLNYKYGSGSGSGDLFAYIPESFFAGASENDYLYLYSHFGGKGVVGHGKDAISYSADAGFEEWAYLERITPSQSIPLTDGGLTLAFLGAALLCTNVMTRRSSRA